MASPIGAQSWTDSDTDDVLYGHAVLLLLSPLNLLDPARGKEQDRHGTRPRQYVYSAIVVFVHPDQTLVTIPETITFFKVHHDDIIWDGHLNGWCILCKLPSFEMSWFFPMIPYMLHLTLPASMSNVDPSVPPMLHLDLAGCNADCLFIWLLHNMQWHDMEYAIMPPALWCSLVIPWEIRMEEFPKLWQNTTYITCKVGTPDQDVGLAMKLVTTCHIESKPGR